MTERDCPHCGAEVPYGEICNHCGASLFVSDEAERVALVKETRHFALGALVVGSIAGVLVAIGAVLPWSTVTVGIFVGGHVGDAVDVIGMIAIGVLVVAGALIAGLSAQPQRALYLLMLCLALVSIQAGYVVVAMHRLNNSVSTAGSAIAVSVTPGVGTYLMIAGALLIAVAIVLVAQTSYAFNGFYGVFLSFVAIVGFSIGGGVLARSPALTDLSGTTEASASTTATTVDNSLFTNGGTVPSSTPTTSTQSALASFNEVQAENSGSAFSPVVSGTASQFAAMASGYVLHVYQWKASAWKNVQDIQLDVEVDTSTPIQTGFWTGNGQPNFLVTLAGADAGMGSLVDFNTSKQDWELAPFGAHGPSSSVPNLGVTDGMLQSVENDCNPDCATGHDTTEIWAYDAPDARFVVSKSLVESRD